MRRTWLYSAAVRSVKTMAQTAVAMCGTATVLSEVDFKYVISATLLAGLLSILTSLAGLPEVDDTKLYKKEKDDIEVEKTEENQKA